MEVAGCRYFTDALAVNRTLKTLKLNGNGANPRELLELVQVATRAGILTRLEIAFENLIEYGDSCLDVFYYFDRSRDYFSHLYKRPFYTE